MSLNELLTTMQNEMYGATEEIEKFMNGNKSAGTRVRKNMQNIKTVAQNVRQKVQEMKNNS